MSRESRRTPSAEDRGRIRCYSASESNRLIRGLVVWREHARNSDDVRSNIPNSRSHPTPRCPPMDEVTPSRVSCQLLAVGSCKFGLVYYMVVVQVRK